MKTKLTVRNCPVEFRFQCSKLWEELVVSSNPAIRHCNRCGSDVFLCTTDEETIDHARAGRCIAREVPDSSERGRMVVGQPAMPLEVTPQQQEARRRYARESAIDDSIRNAAGSARTCPRCSYPAPAWRTTCRVCGFEIGRHVGEASA